MYDVFLFHTNVIIVFFSLLSRLLFNFLVGLVPYLVLLMIGYLRRTSKTQHLRSVWDSDKSHTYISVCASI